MKNGFTLVETLIAMLILTVGLAGVAFVFLYSVRTTWLNQQRTTAELLLEQKLDKLRAAPLNDHVWLPGQYSDYSGPYRRTWRISGASIRTLNVTVSTGVLELSRATTMAAP